MTERTTIENNPAAVAKLVKKIAVRGAVEFVYEAGPCGYETHRQIAGLGSQKELIGISAHRCGHNSE